MELIEAMKERKSVRGFKSTPVPSEIISNILDLARLSPSGLNMQPWEFVLLTGESLQKAKDINVKQATTGAEVNMDVLPYQITGQYHERQAALGKNLYQVMNIRRDDAQQRTEWMLTGLRFYDAPAAILVCLDEEIFNTKSQMALIDIGLITQGIVLLAPEYGLGTCIQAAPVMYASALKQALDMPKSKRLILSIAVGYPDSTFPANQFRSERQPLEKFVTWK